MTLVLEPVPSAKHGFLSEALEYCLSGKIPLSTFPPLRGNPFFDRDAEVMVVARSIFDPRNWRYELDYGTGIEWFDPPAQEHTVSRHSPYAKSIISRVKAELFLKLSRGDLNARGRPYPGPVYFPDIGNHDKVEGTLQYVEFEPIPKEFWLNDSIRWDGSLAEGLGRAVYFHIQVDVEQLLSLRPIEPARFGHVGLYEQQLILDDWFEVAKPRGKKRGPKPRFDKEAIEEEALRRLLSGRAEKSRDDLAGQLRVWYERQFDQKAPAVSTISGYIKPMYDIYEEVNRQRSILNC